MLKEKLNPSGGARRIPCLAGRPSRLLLQCRLVLRPAQAALKDESRSGPLEDIRPPHLTAYRATRSRAPAAYREILCQCRQRHLTPSGWLVHLSPNSTCSRRLK